MANPLGVKWELANPYGIAVDERNGVWHSGHVTDVLELDGGDAGLLVATETGGVWSISPNGMTVPLSDGWDKPDVNCLAFGPDGDRHLYAGSDGVALDHHLLDDGAVYESDVRAPSPLLAWKPIDQPLPSGAGHVNRILVLRN